MASKVLQDASQQTSNGSITDGWPRSPYGIRLVEDPDKMFKTLIEIERFNVEVEGKGSNGQLDMNVQRWMNVLESTSFNEAYQGILNRQHLDDDFATGSAHGKSLYSTPNYTDTRVGGNDAINPYWQFNRDDDIVPPLLRIPTAEEVTTGMGRVYSEMYDDHQEILWLRMGVPEYVNVVEFFQVSGDADAATAMNTGTLRGLIGKIIKTTVSLTIWAITFPIMAPLHVMRWINDLDAEHVTAYYKFQPAMPLYYEMVNTMLSYLAVSMGLYPVLWNRRDYTKAQGLAEDLSDQLYDKTWHWYSPWTWGRPGEEQALKEIQQGRLPEQTDELTGGAGNVEATMSYRGNVYIQSEDIEAMATSKTGNFESGIPEILRHGPDIFRILNRRCMLFNAQRIHVTTRQLLEEQLKERQTSSQYYEEPIEAKKLGPAGRLVKKIIEFGRGARDSQFFTALKGHMFGAGDYVGFRIERGVNCSESFSNQTRPTAISQRLNQIAAQKKEEMDASFGGSWVARAANFAANGGSAAGFFKMAGLELAADMLSVAGITDVAKILATGNGYLDIPEVWDSSSFSKSYTFNVNLKARYGDPVSIFQSIYIPLVMLLATALPRSIGDNMYTSPFLINAYCKGKFAVPCGMIGSMSITRGKDDYGWNVNGLPTSVDVSFDIHDLSPAMFLSMQDVGFFDTFKRNNNFLEYLDTLSALSLSERLYLFPKMQRKFAAACLITRNTILNPAYWGFKLGRSKIARALAAVTPFGNYEKTDMQYNATQNGPFGIYR